MYRWLVICVLGAVLFSSGCGSSQGGRWPTPVWKLKLGELTMPSAPIAAGDEVEFTMTWVDGRSPYTVDWDFDGGMDPPELTTSVEELTHTAEVVAVNDTETAVEYAGSVTITDTDGTVVTSTFGFTVDPPA